MYVIDNLASTYITIAVAPSFFANPLNIAGNFLELSSENELLQATTKVLQSINLSYLCLWATIQTCDFWNISLDSSISAGLSVGITVLSLPLITLLVKYCSPECREIIEDFEKYHLTVLKIVNVVTAGVALGCGIHLGYAIPALLQSGVSLILSAYTLSRIQDSKGNALRTV